MYVRYIDRLCCRPLRQILSFQRPCGSDLHRKRFGRRPGLPGPRMLLRIPPYGIGSARHVLRSCGTWCKVTLSRRTNKAQAQSSGPGIGFPSRQSRHRSPEPHRYSSGKIAPAATARKNRTIPQTVLRFDPRFSPHGRTAYAAIQQPVPCAHSGYQRSRRAASSASQCSKYSTTWLTT